MTDQPNGNHIAEETVAPAMTRQQRRAAEAAERIAAREANAAAPPEATSYSPEWFDNLIAINEANLRQQQGNVSALRQQLAEAERAEQRIVGALEALRALKQMGQPQP